MTQNNQKRLASEWIQKRAIQIGREQVPFWERFLFTRSVANTCLILAITEYLDSQHKKDDIDYVSL